MSIRRMIVDVVSVFSMTLLISIVVSVIWNLIVHKTRAIDWETSVRFAILLGIIVPWMQSRRNKDS